MSGMWVLDVMDEVALEGLDGITLSSLWVRLKQRNGFQFNVDDDKVRDYLWRSVICNPSTASFLFYELETPRSIVQVYDRFQHVSPTGLFLEDAEQVPQSPYTMAIVRDRRVKGSCSQIDSRKIINCSVLCRLSLPEVEEKYGDKLVVVASQEDRYKALGLNDVDPFMFISDSVYCYLELVGRSREQGLATIGLDTNLLTGNNTKIDSKAVFYYRKVCLKKGLISKSPYSLVTAGKTSVTKGFLVFLTRFHQKCYSPAEKMAVKMSNILLEQPNQECDYVTLRAQLEEPGKKMVASILTTFRSNFESVMRSKKEGEKTAARKMVRLLKPVDLEAEEKEESDPVSEDADEEDVDVTVELTDETLSNGYLFEPSLILADRTMLSQVVGFIEQSTVGATLRDISEKFRLSKLDSRIVAKLLERNGLVKVTKEERGRQTISRYCSTRKSNQDEQNQAKPSFDTVVKQKRAEIILEVLTKADDGIVFGLFLFVKEIRSRESSGYRCDTRSVIRLIRTLHQEGKLRLHIDDNEDVKLRVACECTSRPPCPVVTLPEVVCNYPMLLEKMDNWSFRQQNRPSNSGYTVRKTGKKMDASLPEITHVVVNEYEYNPSIGRRKYGHQVKMKKIMTLYKFLFHLLRGKSRGSKTHSDWEQVVKPLPFKAEGNICSIRDFVPRMPISLFCKVVSITHEIPGLEELLNDSSQQNMTLLQAKDFVSHGLLYRRRYIYNILSLLTSLTEIGLVELENTDTFTHKDETRVKVLNTFTFTHSDTTTVYSFSSTDDIEKFEMDLANHCLSVCSGCNLPESLFAHRSTNWGMKPARLISRTHFRSEEGVVVAETSDFFREQDFRRFSQLEADRKRKRIKRKSQPENEPQKRTKTSFSTSSDPSGSKNKKRKLAFDDDDRKALSCMTRRRCVWTQQEDNFLLLCRVATLLLGKPDRNFINVRIVREELHKRIPMSCDKTRQSCARRILYMLRDERTRENVQDWLSEFLQDDSFAEIEIPNVAKSNEEVWDTAFMQTLDKVLHKFLNLQEDRSKPVLNITESTIRPEDFVDVSEKRETSRTEVFVEPKNTIDIHVNVVENVLLASLVVSSEGTPIDEMFSYALFRIYGRYPDSLVRSVVAKMKKNNVIAHLKKWLGSQSHNLLRTRGQTPYKLSMNFSFLMQTKYSMDSLMKPIDLTQAIEDKDGREDALFAVNLLTCRSGRFTINIPEDFIALESDNPFGRTASPAKAPRDVLNVSEKRTSSRSVLYAFREQLSLSTKQPRDKIQDYLVLNKCGVSVALTNGIIIPQSFNTSLRNVLTSPSHTTDVTVEQRSIAQIIETHKELGCTREQIEDKLGHFPEEEITRLESQSIVIRVGIRSFRWVHHNFLTPWIVRSIAQAPDEEPIASSTDPRERSQIDVEYIAKVWRKPDGKPDSASIIKYMQAIVGHVMTFPGISQTSLLSHFHIAAPATQLLELLELMLAAGIISVTIIPRRTQVGLFTAVTHCPPTSFDLTGSVRLLDDKACERYFEVTANGIPILSQLREELTGILMSGSA